MAIESKDITIGDVTYKIESLPATEGLKVLARITKLAGGVGDGVRDIPETPEEVSEVFDFGAMVQGVLERIDVDTTPTLIKNIIRQSLPQHRGKKPVEFDTWYEFEFSRNFMHQFELLVAIFEWNYGDALVWLKKTFASLLQKKWAAALASGGVAPSIASTGGPKQSFSPPSSSGPSSTGIAPGLKHKRS